jgi:hypothetical protein
MLRERKVNLSANRSIVEPNWGSPHRCRRDRVTITDLHDHWEMHGQAALDEHRQKFVDRYIENFSLLVRVIRVEADETAFRLDAGETNSDAVRRLLTT